MREEEAAAAAAAAALAGRKRAREEAAAAAAVEAAEGGEEGGAGAPAPGAAQGAWSQAEEAHLLALLARFPMHGEPSTTRAGPGTDANTAFWTRIAACLQSSADGSGRSAYAVYKRSTMLRRR